MVQMIKEDAWKYLWKLAWSEALLEKFKDRADWETVSGNRDIAANSIFKNRINWSKLNRDFSKSLLSRIQG